MRKTIHKEQYKFIYDICVKANLSKNINTPTKIDKLIKEFFHNKYSFKLSKSGFNYMKPYVKFVKIALQENTIKSKYVLSLNFGMKSPFYHDYKTGELYATECEGSAILLLSNGDLELYTEMIKNGKSV